MYFRVSSLHANLQRKTALRGMQWAFHSWCDRCSHRTTIIAIAALRLIRNVLRCVYLSVNLRKAFSDSCLLYFRSCEGLNIPQSKSILIFQVLLESRNANWVSLNFWESRGHQISRRPRSRAFSCLNTHRLGAVTSATHVVWSMICCRNSPQSVEVTWASRLLWLVTTPGWSSVVWSLAISFYICLLEIYCTAMMSVKSKC